MLLLFSENVSLDFGKDQMLNILLMTLVSIACCVECLGEELGWIGYLYGKIESMVRTIWTCVILRTIRGVYHIGILIHMDYTIPAFLELTLSNICLSFFMVYLYKRSESIFTCSISHGISGLLPILLIYNQQWYYTNPLAMIVSNFWVIVFGVFFCWRLTKDKQKNNNGIMLINQKFLKCSDLTPSIFYSFSVC